MKKNREIELVRFFAALIIVLHHAGTFANGWLAVEGFAVLSGMLMARTMKNKQEQLTSSFAFIVAKIKVFYPELVGATILGILMLNFPSYSACELRDIVCNSFINNLLLLRMTGIWDASVGVIPPSWYLSSMIIAMIIAYPIVRVFKDNLVLLAGSLLLTGALMDICGGSIPAVPYTHKVFFTYIGNVRIFNAILLGYAVFGMIDRNCFRNYIRRFASMANVTKMLLYLVVAFMLTTDMEIYYGLYIIAAAILLAMIFLSSQVNQHGNKGSRFDKVSHFLGKISLSIFLAHYPAIRLSIWLQNQFPENKWIYFVSLFVGVSFSTLIVYGIALLLRKFFLLKEIKSNI